MQPDLCSFPIDDLDAAMPSQDAQWLYRKWRCALLPRPRGRRLVLLATFIIIAVTAAPARAANFSLEAGSSWTIGQRSTSAVFLSVMGTERTWGGLYWQPEFDLGGIKHRNVPLRNLDRNVGIAAFGVRLPHLWRDLYFSFQLAVASPHTSALSSTQQFVSSLGWQQGRIVVMLRHISNGGTHEPNYGESMLLVGVECR
ncbi:MAG: hypothetical protein ACYCUI_10725 [Vulcanimicrobiaceae bacterium]